MSVSERIKPVNTFQTTLDNLMMPIAVLVLYQIIFAIVNLLDQRYDDTSELANPGSIDQPMQGYDNYIGLGDTTGYAVAMVLLAFWIGVTAIQEGGSIGDAMIGGAFVGFTHGLLRALFEELFSETILRGDLTSEMVQFIIYWIGIFVLVSTIGAGLAEDWLFETKPKPVRKPKPKPKPKPVARKPAKKKTTKKPAKKKTTRKARPVEDFEDEYDE